MEDILFNKNFTCVAVSKTKPIEDIEKIYNLGHKDFGAVSYTHLRAHET